MPETAFSEKRNFPRFPIRINLSHAEVSSPKTSQTKTYNISANGVCIETDEKLRPGACIDICLQMADDGEQIYRRGKVVWSTTLVSDKHKAGILLEEPRLKPISIVLRVIKSWGGKNSSA